jgi:LytS/YehU family sensor histidine kinase
VPLAAYLNAHYFLVDQPQPTLSAIFIASVLNIFIWTVILVAGKIGVDRYRFQLYVDEVEKAKVQAELDFLNAQLNPHFLFNSLNSIYGNIDKKNTEARNMLLTFSEMLRYQLYTSNKNSISIEEEIDYLKNYVALQKTRKDERFKISFTVASAVQGFTVAPLLFIAFVENAFKYVSTHEERENRVDISFEKKDSALVFKCYNSKELNGHSHESHKGIGIDNTKRRLALHYKDKHELKITNDSSFYEVDLKIELT